MQQCTRAPWVGLLNSKLQNTLLLKIWGLRQNLPVLLQLFKFCDLYKSLVASKLRSVRSFHCIYELDLKTVDQRYISATSRNVGHSTYLDF